MADAARSPSIRDRFSALLDRVFGPMPPPENPPSGLPRLKRLREPEGLYLLYAFLLALGVAVVLEWIISAAPVPPGGDPGQWISAAYPWIHPTYPSQVIFLGYPPLVFPLLGLFDVLGGGAIAAGQIYVGFGAVVLGVSTYVFARSALHRPILALLVEGFTLLTAQFMRLFFFGSYPTILALALMSFACAAFLRWLGSHRSAYLFLAWTLLAATLLAHSLVGLVAFGTLAFSCLVLLFERRLPKTFLFSPAGAAGCAVFVGSVGGYYLGTRYAGIAHPNYFSQNALGRTKTNLSQLLFPFHLGSIPGVFGHHHYFSGAESFGIAVGFVVVIFFLIAFLASRGRLPSAVLVVGAMILAVVAIGVAGWVLSIVTDYRRFAYLLYIPIGIAAAYMVDFLLGVFLQLGRAGSDPLPKPRRRPRYDAIGLTIAIVGVAGLVFVGGGTTVPVLQGYEVEYTGAPHSAAYLQAIGAINHDGRPGSVLTDDTPSARWTRALTDRNTYANSQPTDFVFYGSQILDDELALFAFQNYYGVTDGVTSATLPDPINGTGNQTNFTAAPQYNAMREGISLPVLTILPGSLSVLVGVNRTGCNNSNVSRCPGVKSVFVPSFTQLRFDFTTPGDPSFVLTYVDPSFNVTEIVAPHPPSDGFTISFNITAARGFEVRNFTGLIQAASGSSGVDNAKSPWNATTATIVRPGLGPGGMFPTHIYGNGTEPAGRTQLTKLSAKGPRLHIGNLRFSETGDFASNLSFSLYVTTPGANNLIPSMPPVLFGPSIFQQWDADYALLNQNSTNFDALFEGVYGATPLATEPGWTVLSMPSRYAAPPYLTPS